MNMKMSDVFELPVRASQLEVYGANSNPEITFDDIESAAAHAINSHDQLVDTITEQEKVISELQKEHMEMLMFIQFLANVMKQPHSENVSLHHISCRAGDILAKHKQSKGE